jgi:HK97 gp10 family phage protein
MSTTEVTIKGLDQLQAKLESLPHDVGEKLIHQTLNRVGRELAERMSANAPVSTEAIKTPGFLASQMVTRFHSYGKDNEAGMIGVGPSKTEYPRRGNRPHYHGSERKHNKTTVFGDTVRVDSVAEWCEFGTHHEKANPFLTRSFEEFKDTALAEIIEDLTEALDAATK